MTTSRVNKTVISITGHGSYYKHQASDFILYTIQPGDTLHNLSVKYSCPVASIKRLNNLWSEQEFYGLTKIKLPVGRFRLIADAIQHDGDGNNDTSNKSDDAGPSFYDNSLGHSINSSLSPAALAQQSSTQRLDTVAYLSDDDSTCTSLRSESIFKNLDQHIEKAREAAKSYDDNASAIMQSLAQGGNLVADETSLANREAEKLLNDLSDFGLSYNFLLLFVFIVCLVCPLAYVIYLEETHRDHHYYHHDTTNQNT